MEVLLLWTEWPCNDIDLLSQCSNSHPAHVDSVSTYLPGHLFLLPPFYALFFNGFVVLLWGGGGGGRCLWFGFFSPQELLVQPVQAICYLFFISCSSWWTILELEGGDAWKSASSPGPLFSLGQCPMALFQAVQVCSPAVKVCDLNMLGIRVLNHI